MSYRDIWPQQDERMRQEDENAAYMYSRPIKDGPTPFYLDCPLDAIESVARGLATGSIQFFLRGASHHRR